MISQWTPESLAIFSLSIMLIPAGLTVFSLIFSIFTSLFVKVAGINSASHTGEIFYKTENNVLYLAYIGVILLNLTTLGLIASGIWAVFNFVVNIFS